jgi:transposase
VVSRAYGEVVRSTVRIVAEMTEQIGALEGELEARFEEHPDAKVLRSLPGLGSVLGARVLAEFGDGPTRYADPKTRKNYAGTSPITKASGRSRVATARFARNRRLADALEMWAFCYSPPRREPGDITTRSRREGTAPIHRKASTM